MGTTSLDVEVAGLSEDRELSTDSGNLFTDYIWFNELETSLPKDEIDALVSCLA